MGRKRAKKKVISKLAVPPSEASLGRRITLAERREDHQAHQAMPAPSKKKDKAAASPEASVCANCGVQEGQHGATLSKCRKCKATLYCSRDCQRAHWDAGHKGQCVRPEDRAPEKAPLASGGGGDEDECPICLEPLAEGSALTLPCTHRFHPGCV